MRRHFFGKTAALLVVVPLMMLVFAKSARAELDYFVTLKDGSAYQGELVEYAPGDHVVLHLATGENKRFAWSELATPALPPEGALPAPSSSTNATPPALPPLPADLAPATTPTVAVTVNATTTSVAAPQATPADGGPKAGMWSADVRIPLGLTMSDPSLSFQGLGLEFGLGPQLGDNVRIGGFAGISQQWNLSGGAPLLFARGRVGGDLQVVYHRSQNDVAPGETQTGHDQWIGFRGGAEAVRSISPTGGFAEIDLGFDSWTGDSSFAAFGTVLGAGLSFEPPGIYGAAGIGADDTSDATTAAATRTVSPYFTAAIQFGFGG